MNVLNQRKIRTVLRKTGYSRYYLTIKIKKNAKKLKKIQKKLVNSKKIKENQRNLKINQKFLKIRRCKKKRE